MILQNHRFMAVRAITFDVYSALFDAVRGLTGSVARLFHQRGLGDDAAAVAQLWRQKHMEYLLVANSLERERASNRRAIDAAAAYALRRLNPPVTADEMRALASAWERLPPWPEAAEVLREVRQRPLTLAALSNGDDGMLRTLLASLPVQFDAIISTEGAKFKPHPSVYRMGLERLRVRPDEWLHVAGSATDAMGATAAGIPTVWVNRAGDAVIDARYRPPHQVADLRGVLEFIRPS